MFLAIRRVQIAASDFARSRRFYGETLGLPEVGSFERDWVEFGLGPVTLKLSPLRPGEVPSRNQVAVVLSTDALDTTLTALKERGVTVTRGPVEEFKGRFAEILDPDGYRLVVFQPSELHPEEEWLPAARVDEMVKQRVEETLEKERAKPPKKEPAPKPAPKPKPKKPVARPAAKKPAAKAAASRKR